MSISGDNELKDYQPKKAIVNAPLQWTDLRLSEQVKSIRFMRDKDNNIIALAVVPFDPTQTGLNILPMGRVGISDPGAVNSYARVFGLPCCGWPETTLGLVTHSTQMLQKLSNLEARRTQSSRKIGSSGGAGSTAIWTPAAGYRIRLLGISIFVGGNVTLAAAGLETVSLMETAAAIFTWGLWISNAAMVGAPYLSKEIIFPDNGMLFATNAVLNLNLSAATATGAVQVVAWGMEEI